MGGTDPGSRGETDGNSPGNRGEAGGAGPRSRVGTCGSSPGNPFEAARPSYARVRPAYPAAAVAAVLRAA
ncbi:hypothetical protein HMPREF1317_2289, partial [Schaalia georgiae F0490]